MTKMVYPACKFTPGKLYQIKTREPKCVCAPSASEEDYFYAFEELLIFITEDRSSRKHFVCQVFLRLKTGAFEFWDDSVAGEHIGELCLTQS